MVTRVLLRRAVCGGRPLIVMGPSAGAGVIDQSQPGVINSVVDVCDSDYAAQTFTNGITGRLDQVDLAVARSPKYPAPRTFIVEIWLLSGGVLAGASVAATACVAKLEGAVSTTPLKPAEVPATSDYGEPLEGE